MNINLHDYGQRLRFAPLTLTRPIGDIRMGILTNAERWKLLSPSSHIGFETDAYLSEKYPSLPAAISVNAAVIPNEELVQVILQLKGNEALMQGGDWLATSGAGDVYIEYKGREAVVLKERWHLYQYNGHVLEADFECLTRNRASAVLSSSNRVIGDPSRIFLEEGAIVEASVLNTQNGPIYIGKDAEVMEGCLLRGPIALCEHSGLKMGAKVYGATTLGPHCKVGGEVNNVLFQAYSNKGHDGFLGNSCVGEWCNLGADTNTSNLKNNYGTVKCYSYETRTLIQTDVQFMGLMMGDHSKCGINTMFNTATVVGVMSNIFGAGFPDKHIPSFSWGSDQRFEFDKAVEAANNMMTRRGCALSTTEIAILRHIADKM